MSGSQHPADRMATVAHHWESRADRRAVFLHCYHMMSLNMLRAVKEGEVHDSLWVSALLERFADYYFSALDAYEGENQTIPIGWKIAHEAAGDERTQVIQILLLGVNAHINYDLVLTLVEMLESEWPGLWEAGRRERYVDHCHVNAVIVRTIDSVQDQVIEPLSPDMDTIDNLFGLLDEWMVSSLISRWREEAWEHALEMLAMSDPAVREQRRRELEASTQGRAKSILFQGSPADITRLL